VGGGGGGAGWSAVLAHASWILQLGAGRSNRPDAPQQGVAVVEGGALERTGTGFDVQERRGSSSGGRGGPNYMITIISTDTRESRDLGPSFISSVFAFPAPSSDSPVCIESKSVTALAFSVRTDCVPPLPLLN
jgi:hypothetical protein